ncbi:hypothetical protein HK097_003545 [Rhizophlyctis rosea]|uniref:LIM zinc-binding domain-containing protein n=1 Tax=Rhizophlyctis rosea TaxID=64517 RepID=A0AAD5X004_9FUNG|nr:hypothetical protein HK097_003545 [Rhizophlyctis rosea]
MFWEYAGKPYCEYHYHELTGEVCGFCHEPVSGKVVTALYRQWCERHFACHACQKPLATPEQQHPFMDVDFRPFCKRCFECLSVDVRKQLNKYGEIDRKAEKEGLGGAKKREKKKEEGGVKTIGKG